MKLRVDLLPHGGYSDTVLVVDILRATTTAVAYLERGADALLLTRSPELALSLRDTVDEGGETVRNERYRLGGERGGLPIPGFDFGNSPVEAVGQNFTGREVVMNTTNGTGAAHVAAQSGKHVLLASLVNAHAAARRARALSVEEIAIVCAGTDERVSLEDVYAAGVLAEYLLAMGEFSIDDGARIALTLRRNLGNPLEALSSSSHGVTLERLGLGDDVRWAARISESTIVPTLDMQQGIEGTLRFVAG
ncbi:2-phosphosulfolactate phosphatase [Deinococcus sp.]|uniref:2-phosphosulfolactate phosphatase n=1 Tax=Deinococcus sp. TaxID=47478 RepID=UPI003CC5EF3B